MDVQTREIEVKYRVDDSHAVAEVLARRGAVWSFPVSQDDQAYAPADWDYSKSKLGVAFARLRTEGGRHVFTVKIPQANEQACAEHETEVANRERMHLALLAMGWAPTVRIVKTRLTARLQDVWLCVDDVEHAGAFLEVEAMASGGEGDLEVQERLEAFVLSLGVAGERVSDTYDSLVRQALARA
ncbi:MAG: class IV adenylate cyclase [Stackebrandtia sp.]